MYKQLKYDKMTSNLKFKWLIIPVAVLFCQTALSQKKVISITSKIEIKATQSEVFALLKNLERYPEWSPFLVTDPKQKHHLTGITGELGSSFYWEGVTEKSKGFQTLTALSNNDHIKYACTIEKPFKGNPIFDYRFSQKEGTIEVVQEFNLGLSGFSYFMTKLFGVKKKMIATNKLGLERLKSLVEKESTIK
jgi:Polyketide cyclase / dehydrase and lipid transport